MKNKGLFTGLRWRLLLYQLSVMAAILGVFGVGVYAFFSRSLYQQLDQKLMTLAQAATPSMKNVATDGQAYLEQLNEVPWRDIFNHNQQSLEWFNINGEQLARRGQIELQSPPRVGPHTIAGSPPVRTFTVSVFEDAPNSNSPTLRGYIRASQTTQTLQTTQRHLLIGLALGGGLALAGAGAGGLWLTRLSLRPIEGSYQRLIQFTADASHELRGPLTAIKTSVGVMQRHPERVHPRDQKKLQAINSATTQLGSLAEDLLLLARMDAERGHPVAQTVVLNALLQEIIELYSETARLQGIDLQLQETVTATVIGQRAQLNRLFTNLIQNALNYTQQGRITVQIGRQRRHALVKIQDTGIGIAPQDIPQVFNRFWRADPARSAQAGGSGLGLAIAKAITEQHGGRIWVTSRLHQGSCFHIQLPMTYPAVARPDSQSGLASSQQFSG